MLGLRTFFFRDVVNIKVLGEDQEARQRLLKVCDMLMKKINSCKVLSAPMKDCELCAPHEAIHSNLLLGNLYIPRGKLLV